MSEYDVNAQRRAEAGKGAARRLRAGGDIPGVLYGAGKDPEMIAVNQNELRRQLENEAFFSHILNVKVEGEETQAVLKALQRDPASAAVVHVDFLRVEASEQITMRIPLHFLNEDSSPGRKAGGVVSHMMVDVEVSCLPKDLPEYIDVDLADLALGDSIHLSQVVLPDGVTLTANIEEAAQDHPVAAVQMPQALEVVEEAVEEEEGVEEEAAPAPAPAAEEES